MSVSEVPAVSQSLPVILIGASNLTLGWHSVLRQLCRACPGQLDVHVVAGMGRSYVKSARFAHRSLPSIVDCGLWGAIPGTSSGAAPRVLVTDAGNDLAYGLEPEQIVDGVRACLTRIRAWWPEAPGVLTLPPLASLRTLGSVRFRAARALLFPGSQLLLPDVLRLAGRLTDLLQELGRESGFSLVTPPSAWYGLDPIHIRRGAREAAFGSMFSQWGCEESVEGSGLVRAVPAWPWLPTPAERWLFRRPRLTPQPVFSGPDLRISSW